MELTMKVFPLVLVASLFIISVFSYAQPKIQLNEGSNLEFGDVVSGNKISKEISIKNGGTDTLHIKDVRAQCGCTATLLTEKILAPNQAANLSITFNSAGYRPGRATKHVYIDSDDPATPTMTIEFSPNVIQYLEATPNMLSFNSAKVDTVITKSVMVKNTSKDTINIVAVDSKFEYLKVSLSKQHLVPGDSTELTGVLNTPKAGSYQSTVTLLTDNPNLPKFEIKSFMWVNRK
ncbi:MAG: DUF1573 domain-containing protein [Bacteroidetes bacterium]|nr:MAG: DUF1573 domain-containing protein [Bacteroidota bacterium]